VGSPLVQQKKHQEERACDKKQHVEGDDGDDDDMIYLIFVRQTVQKGTKGGTHYSIQNTNPYIPRAATIKYI
jgi:hypothetical protein